MSSDTLSRKAEEAAEAAYAKRSFDQGLREERHTLLQAINCCSEISDVKLTGGIRWSIRAILIMESGAVVGEESIIKSLEEWQGAFNKRDDVIASYLVGTPTDGTKANLPPARFNPSELVYGEPTAMHAQILKDNFPV